VRGTLVAGLLCLTATAAHANGRVPGATGLAIHPTDERRMLLGLTYGLALSRDHGASWSWICEQQIDGNGGDVDPAMVVTGDGTLVVVSLTNGGILVSRDDGCSFERLPGLLQGQRGVDLTLDPSQPGHVLALMSTIVSMTEAGRPRFRSFVAHSLDHGRNWSVLAELPDDLWVETLEIAPSDANRIYVSGTAADNLLQGVVLRSDDRGLTWTRSTVELPAASGSLFLSAIHPSDPDRLWFRVPTRGDLYGALPAKLWRSTDGAMSFDQVAEAEGGFLGFALSPDGERIAFGGPLNGLFLAPSDDSAAPTKIDDLIVTCLRWLANGLYVCAVEPVDPYTVGFAVEPTEGFVPVFHNASTCREGCAPASSLELKCREPWEMLAPLIDAGAGAGLCEASSSTPDGGIDGGVTAVDASPVTPEPNGAASARDSGGCTVAFAPGVSTPWWLAAVLSAAALSRGSRPRRCVRPGRARTRRSNWRGIRGAAPAFRNPCRRLQAPRGGTRPRRCGCSP
jgi:hypothetical protein